MNSDNFLKYSNRRCSLHDLPNSLKILNLSGIVNMNDYLLDIVTTNCTKLLKLDISKSHITNDGIYNLERLEYLNTCNLSFTRITDESFEIIGELITLRKLNISMCALITNSGIEILVKEKNPKLTHINMEYTNTGQLAVNSMAEYLKAPIYINMDYTHYAEFIDGSILEQKCKSFYI